MNSSTDPLPSAAERWLEQRGHAALSIEPLAGDVSPRRYLRVRVSAATSQILASYPSQMRDVGDRFVATTNLLAAAGVPVPEIVDWDPEAGLMLVADAGREAVHQAVAAGASPMPYWHQAAAHLRRIAELDLDVIRSVNPQLDSRTLRREIRQSWDLVLEPTGLVGDDSLAQDFRWALFAVCDRLGEAEPRPCHRDFMARNLLLDSADRIIVIDHQDLRPGPPWYDLASLLNDTLYADEAQEAEVLNLLEVPRPEREGYHRAAAQRALKIVGTFAGFAARGVDRHLPLIPPSLQAARRHLERLPETGPVMRDLAGHWDDADLTAVGIPRSLLD